MKRTSLMIAVLGIFLAAQIAQAQWTPTKRLTWNSGDSRGPAIATDSSGNLHLVWFDSTPGLAKIYYKKSTDGGATWAANKRISWTSGWSGYPAIAVDSSDNLHVVWWDSAPGNNEIYYTKSTDGGATWTASRRLTWTSGSSLYPALAVGFSGNLHLVWYDDTPGNSEIYYRKSSNGGVTWTTSQRLTFTSGRSIYPAIAVDSIGSVHVIWSDETPGNLEIYHKKSTDGGATWTANQRLTWTLGAASYGASIAVNPSGTLQLVWNDFAPGNEEIYYRKSTDGGTTWTPSQRLTWTSGSSLYPAIGVDSLGGLHVIWQDDTPGNNEIYYKKSTDGGAIWTANQRLTWTSGQTRWPNIAVDFSDNLHAVWWDDTPGNNEIYYKKGK